MNKWTGIGRLTRDSELRYTPSGVAVTTFTIAVDRRFKNAQGEKVTDFIRVKTFKQLAELCANYLSKGKLCAVSGELQISEYTDKDGQKRWSTDIAADEVQFLSPKSEDTQGQPQPQPQPTTQQPHPNMPNPNIPPGANFPPGTNVPPGYNTGYPPGSMPPPPGYNQAPPAPGGQYSFGREINLGDDIPF